MDRKLYNSIPVISFNEIDAYHGRPNGTARNAFNRKKRFFVLGKDFFDLPCKTWMQLYEPINQGSHRGNRLVFTETGYLKIIRSFRDDAAWRQWELQEMPDVNYKAAYYDLMKSFNKTLRDYSDHLKEMILDGTPDAPGGEIWN